MITVYLLLLLVVRGPVTVSSAAVTTAYISQAPGTAPDGQPTTTLWKALSDKDVGEIILVGDYYAGDEFRSLVGTSFPITRNVSITSLPGQWFTLDLNFAYDVVELCGSCTFKLLANLTLENARRGPNPSVDFFVGKPGSILLLDGIYRRRIACTEAKESEQTLLLLRRSKQLPGANQPQKVEISDVTYQGHVHPASMQYIDITADMPYQHDEGRGFSGGYALGISNSVRICEHYVSQECLAKESPESCINELIDQLQAEEQRPPGLSTGALAAAIAVPVVVAIVLVAGLLLYLRRRKQQQQQQGNSDKAFLDSEACTGKSGRRDTLSVSGSSCGQLGMPKGTDQGWELQSSFTSPFLGDIDRDEADGPIAFGEFIGAGSFGRVYCAKWANRDVAVKVIEHSHDQAQSVLNEMHLMMAFNSPYVVRAYKCLTYARTGAGDSICTEFSSAGSTDVFGGPPLLHAPSSVAAVTAGSGNSQPCATTGSNGRQPAAAAATGQSNAGSASAAAPSLVKAVSFDPNTPGSPPLISATAAAAVVAMGSTPNNGSGGILQSSKNSNPKQQERGNPLATWLVQEYCDEGTLKAYVTRNELSARLLGGGEAMMTLLMLLRDTAKGLSALHAQAVVHGDLNSRNVLVASDAGAECRAVAKIADLGISKAIAQHKTHRTTSCLGTITHSAPELLRSGRMAPPIDVYSFGVMMWELYTGQEAFGKLLYGQFYETVVVNDLRPSVPTGMPSDYETLMEHCWATDLAERPSIQQLIACLDYMIDARKQTLAAAAAAAGIDGSSGEVVDAAAAVLPMPELLRQPGRKQQARQQKQQKLLDSMAATSAAAAAGSAEDHRFLFLEPEPSAAAAGQGAHGAAVAGDSSDPLTPVADAATRTGNRSDAGLAATSLSADPYSGGGSSKPHTGILGSSAQPFELLGGQDHSGDLSNVQVAGGLQEGQQLSTWAGKDQATDAGQGQWFV